MKCIFEQLQNNEGPVTDTYRHLMCLYWLLWVLLILLFWHLLFYCCWQYLFRYCHWCSCTDMCSWLDFNFNLVSAQVIGTIYSLLVHLWSVPEHKCKCSFSGKLNELYSHSNMCAGSSWCVPALAQLQFLTKHLFCHISVLGNEENFSATPYIRSLIINK